MTAMLKRMMGAALLDAHSFEDIEADRGANGQALAVVVLASLGAGAGSFENNGWQGIPLITLAALAGWWLWAAITLLVGTKILPGEHTVSDMGELLRTIGFASAPGVLLPLALISPIDWIVFPGCGLWMLASMVVAVRQALDYVGPGRTFRALAVCALGFPLYALIVAAALVVLGPWPI